MSVLQIFANDLFEFCSSRGQFEVAALLVQLYNLERNEMFSRQVLMVL